MGHAALLAGGCVRDLLMDRTPNDFDIASDANPDEVSALFPSALTVGKAFGVTILPFDGFQLEIATFREDLEYKDGRRPEGVRFSTPERDAQRRDFTVNALFYDLETQQVIDFVGGQDDIKKRVIRTVGDPDQRFEEDKLRILRAVRFAAQLDFEIAPRTLEVVIRRANDVNVVSRERVRDELTKLFKSQALESGLSLLLYTGLLRALFPELARAVFLEETLWLRRFEVASVILSSSDANTASITPLDWSALWFSLFFYPLYQEGKEKELRTHFSRDLKLENKLIDSVLFALRNHRKFLSPSGAREGELVLLLTHNDAKLALQLAGVVERCAETLGKLSRAPTEREKKIEKLWIQRLGPQKRKPKPFLSGDDAKTCGLMPGPKLGELLQESYLMQLEGRLANREEALTWLKTAAVT